MLETYKVAFLLLPSSSFIEPSDFFFGMTARNTPFGKELIPQFLPGISQVIFLDFVTEKS